MKNTVGHCGDIDKDGIPGWVVFKDTNSYSFSKDPKIALYNAQMHKFQLLILKDH